VAARAKRAQARARAAHGEAAAREAPPSALAQRANEENEWWIAAAEKRHRQSDSRYYDC